MTVRIAYNLFTQKPEGGARDFARWVTDDEARRRATTSTA